MNQSNLKSGDNEDLEALFDEISEQHFLDESHEPRQVANESHDVFHRVGLLTRKLHDALRELGYDKSIEQAVNALPDARARLNYIAELTGKAAEKVLAAVEESQKLNHNVAVRAAELDRQWERLYNKQMSLDEFKLHVHESREFMKDVGQCSSHLNGHLTDIMLAQDFHDLTGQVVNRIGGMVQTMEGQLLELLLDTIPTGQRKQVQETFLNGPAISPQGRADVCSNQSQVDDLLESLGF